ncbi:ATP-binding protein [Streptomyces sp. WMMC1477]|uniref:ATP-binding protein n=1 Tax=Streptomyces sp. WMMC1477 TaxID=3015155 RepID=UPI0022B6B7B5|nr:ATP-binding protein [Streptomyces sp. WMMC1477]MCZ7431739.1 ATP-binding protein [Streptomyces sp. WMMC1477]
MLEIVAVGALTAFLTQVANGAAGEMGKQLLQSTGALVRRTMGRETPLPESAEGRRTLAGQMHARMARDPRQAGEWSLLVRGLSEQALTLSPGRGLPPAPRDFTNRQRVLRQLGREATRPAAGRPRVALLYGPPGIGTTAVALHLGAAHYARFPDGQFYVDLRDAARDTGPEPGVVLLRLLREMGVEPERVPPTEEGREELYRTLTADRRALVVVDHASSLAQVRNLIPATPEVFLLVVVSGPPFALEAERVPVPPLSDRYAVRMLRTVAGREDTALAKPQIRQLLHHCGGNPLALKTAASGLLRAGDGPAPEPSPGATGRPALPGPAGDAHRRLRPQAARLCGLTALGGWPSVDARLAAAAGAVTEREAGRLLAEAADVHLLEPRPDGRYRFRPEARRLLADRAAAEHGAAACAAATERVLDTLLRRARHAAHAALPQSWRTEPAPDDESPHADEAEGVAALAADVDNLVRAVFVAEEHGHLDTGLRLARALWPLQLKAGYWDEALPALRVAVRWAGEHRPDTRMAGALHFQLAHCLGALERWEEAEGAARAAVATERAAGHLRGEASSVEFLGLLSLYQWRYEAAYERFVESERLYRNITEGQEGAADRARALALSERHQGRALRGMGRPAEAGDALESAVDFFARRGEAYNQARALTDLAETLHDAGDDAAALTRITEAERLLSPVAAPHLRYLANLRLRCRPPG